MNPPSTPDRPASAELLLISSLNRSASRPLSRKRRVTPSYEASSPKRIAILVRPDYLRPHQSRLQRPVEFGPLGWPPEAQEARIGKPLSPSVDV